MFLQAVSRQFWFDAALSHFSKGELLRHLVAIAFGRRQYVPRVTRLRSARIRIASVHPLPARADMVDLGETPVEFRTLTHALRVVAPVIPPAGAG